MRLSYPNVQSTNVSPLLPALPNNALSRVSTRADKVDDRTTTSPALVGSPPGVSGAIVDPAEVGSPPGQSRQGKAVNFPRTSTFERVLSIQAVVDSPEAMPMSRYNTITSSVNTSSTDSADGDAVISPEDVVMDDEYGEDDDADEDDDEDMDDDEEDEEDEETEEDLQPESQYISALDLAGT